MVEEKATLILRKHCFSWRFRRAWKERKSCENPNFHQKSEINVKGIDKAGFCVILSHDLNWDSVPKQDWTTAGAPVG